MAETSPLNPYRPVALQPCLTFFLSSVSVLLQLECPESVLRAQRVVC